MKGEIKRLLFTATLLLAGGLFLLPGRAAAGVAELPGLGYDVNTAMADNLKSLLGKKVRVTLSTGVAFTGNVKAVGTELLHLEKLEGREFFDALLRISEITAIDTRFRDYQP